MFGQAFQHKYALTDQGVRNARKGTLWTVIVNPTVMGGICILYPMMSGFMGTHTGTRLVACAGLSIWLVHLHRNHSSCLPACDWRLMLASLWSMPVAFGLLFGVRKFTSRSTERAKQVAMRVSDGIQEALENVREIRAPNQEDRYLEGLNRKIDEHERIMIRDELGMGIFVNAASVITRLSVATTILVETGLILSDRIDFMLLFLFLMVITRVYAPFDQSLALIAKVFVSQVSADRMMKIYHAPIAEGTGHSHHGDITSSAIMTALPMIKKKSCTT